MIGVSISDVLIHVQAIERLCDALLQWRAARWLWRLFFFAPQDVWRDLTLILLLELRDLGPPEHLHAAFALTAAPARAVRALERAAGPAAGVLGFPHVARAYRQGVVRRNISPEACRDLVEARMLAERMERSFSEHCSQVLFRIPPVLLLQPQMYWAPCTCIAAVGTWTRWPAAASRGLGPARALSCPPSSISQLLVLAAGGPRGARRRPVQHPCPLPGASPSRLGARPFWRGHKAARGAFPPPRLGGGRGLARRRRPLGPAPHGPRSGLDTPGRHNAMDPLGLSHYLSIN